MYIPNAGHKEKYCSIYINGEVRCSELRLVATVAVSQTHTKLKSQVPVKKVDIYLQTRTRGYIEFVLFYRLHCAGG